MAAGNFPPLFLCSFFVLSFLLFGGFGPNEAYVSKESTKLKREVSLDILPHLMELFKAPIEKGGALTAW